jgi:hypothetical protein
VANGNGRKGGFIRRFVDMLINMVNLVIISNAQVNSRPITNQVARILIKVISHHRGGGFRR